MLILLLLLALLLLILMLSRPLLSLPPSAAAAAAAAAAGAPLLSPTFVVLRRPLHWEGHSDNRAAVVDVSHEVVQLDCG